MVQLLFEQFLTNGGNSDSNFAIPITTLPIRPVVIIIIIIIIMYSYMTAAGPTPFKTITLNASIKNQTK